MLHLKVLAECPYVVGVLYGPVAQFPHSPEPGAPELPLYGLCALIVKP